MLEATKEKLAYKIQEVMVRNGYLPNFFDSPHSASVENRATNETETSKELRNYRRAWTDLCSLVRCAEKRHMSEEKQDKDVEQ